MTDPDTPFARAGLIDRRALLLSGSLGTLGGCVTCSLPDPTTGPAEPVADAHAHFFNAADLPVAGFVKLVIIPAYAPNFPQIALGLVDLIGWLAKLLTVSAADETGRLGNGQLFGKRFDVDDFADKAAARQEEMIAAGGAKAFAERRPEENLADSHLYLALLIGAVPPDAAARLAGPGGPGGRLVLDRSVYREIARLGAGAPTRGIQANRWTAADPAGVKAIIRWAFMMCQPRCAHVRTFLETIHAPGCRVRDAANLLVDFDAWLDDRPGTGSSQAQQVEFWTRYAEAAARISGAPRLHSFGGVDPLREVEDRKTRPGQPTHFDTMQTWVEAGRTPGSTARHRIAGFKLYPPMGFRPDTNAGMRLPEDRAGIVVRKRWAANGWDPAQIGAELDASLERIFRYCARRDVPIITHARESNGASSTGNQSAAPQHWIERARMVAGYGQGHHPLRVCLGHFDMYGADAWVLEKALAMNKAGEARFYFDISYDYDVLDGNPHFLLARLAQICEQAGDDGDHICFGSDWIMLGQERQASDYLTTIRTAASGHDFWKTRLDKLFRTNFLDFLGLGGPGGGSAPA